MGIRFTQRLQVQPKLWEEQLKYLRTEGSTRGSVLWTEGPLGKEETDSACPSIKGGAALGQLGPGGVTWPRSSPTRGQGP